MKNTKPPEERRRNRETIYRIEARGPFGCLVAGVVSLVLIVALAMFVFLGMITLTIAVWVACAILLFFVVSAILRSVFWR